MLVTKTDLIIKIKIITRTKFEKMEKEGLIVPTIFSDGSRRYEIETIEEIKKQQEKKLLDDRAKKIEKEKMDGEKLKKKWEEKHEIEKSIFQEGINPISQSKLSPYHGQIKLLVEKSRSVRKAWLRFLSENKDISICYNTFLYYVKTYLSKKLKEKK
ncbi:hypothetical protein [Sulfurospirillum sp. 1612]|uniref:hypothetical protein n=1 Tax=Sulfurospirillum sp. 1612 TaxID=3094835 RepID=UPI002F92395F